MFRTLYELAVFGPIELQAPMYNTHIFIIAIRMYIVYKNDKAILECSLRNRTDESIHKKKTRWHMCFAWNTFI